MTPKMIKYRFLYIGLIVLMICHPMVSLSEVFHTINDPSSLYGSRINDLLEDYDGYLWICTNHGFYRYDGQQMINVAKLLPDQTMDLHTTAIQEDANRHLWIARSYSSNYIVLDNQRKAEDAKQYLGSLGIVCPPLFQIHTDKQGDLWMITQDSLFHYSFGDRTLRSFAHTYSFELEQRPISVCGSQGILYIIEGTSLYTFVEQIASWTEEDLPWGPTTFGKTRHLVNAKGFLDAEDGLWITSFFSEDIIYRPRGEKEWQEIVLPSDHEMKRSNNGRYYNSIRHLAEDKNGNIWVATDHRGLFCYTRATKTWKQFVHDAEDENSIASNNVPKILVDRHGTLWVGYYKVGMSYCYSNLDIVRRQIVPDGDVASLLSDHDGVRWIGTDGHGLWRQDPHGRICQVMEIPDIVIADLQLGRDGHIWVAAYDQGLYEIDPHHGLTTHYTASKGQLPHDRASRIAIDGEGCVWVCSAIGTLYQFNPRTGKAQIYLDETGTDICGEAIGYDPHGDRILIGSYNDVWVHENRGDLLKSLSNLGNGRLRLPALPVSNIWTSSHSPLIWMSHKTGLSVWDTQADTLYQLSSMDCSQLPSSIQSICEDSSHRLWVTGTMSVAVIQPQRKPNGCLEFGIRNILFGKQPSGQLYNLHAIASEPRGTMLLGNTEGFVEVSGQSLLVLASKKDQPKISAIQVGDSIVSLMPFPADCTPLVLPYNHQPLVAYFYSGNLLNAMAVNYSYRVRGLYPSADKNEGWNETPYNSQVFHSLPPGEYTIELRVMGPDGVWSQTCSLPIIVEHPWWSSLTMKVMYGFLVILLVVLAVWLTRRMQNKRMAQAREQLIREHESRITQLTIAPLDEQFLNRVIDIVDEHLSDADFSVEMLAAGVNVSRSLLYKKMMAMTGHSPISFIRRLRMKRASFMLENSQLQITEIAFLVGYNTIKTFTENFKQVYGISPSDYRKQRKKEGE